MSHPRQAIRLFALLLSVAASTACNSTTSPTPSPSAIDRFQWLEVAPEVSLPVHVQGPADSEVAVVILHGGPGLGAIGMFDPLNRVVERLAEEVLVVLYDQRAAGGLAPPPAGSSRFDFDEYSDDALAVIERVRTEYGVERVVVLGHSFGGQLGLALAARHPSAMDALVMMDAAHDERENVRWMKQEALAYLSGLPSDATIAIGDGDVTVDELTLGVEAIRAEDYDSEEHAILELVLEEAGSEKLADGTDVYAFFLGQRYDTPAPFDIGVVLENVEFSEEAWAPRGLEFLDQRSLASSTTRPTLVLWGEQDLVFPVGNAQHLASDLGDRLDEVVVIPGATHFPQLDRPDEVAAAVLDFITRL